MPKNPALKKRGTVILLPACIGHGKKLFPFRFLSLPPQGIPVVPDLLFSLGDMDPIVMLILPNVQFT
jgi:hypothetical protein